MNRSFLCFLFLLPPAYLAVLGGWENFDDTNDVQLKRLAIAGLQELREKFGDDDSVCPSCFIEIESAQTQVLTLFK